MSFSAHGPLPSKPLGKPVVRVGLTDGESVSPTQPPCGACQRTDVGVLIPIHGFDDPVCWPCCELMREHDAG